MLATITLLLIFVVNYQTPDTEEILRVGGAAGGVVVFVLRELALF